MANQQSCVITTLCEVQLEVQPLEDVKASYKIILHFGENNFFEDVVLEKEIKFYQEASQPIICTVSECAPKWKGEVRWHEHQGAA